MNTFLELRDKLKAFYSEYDVYIRPVLKFALAIITYLSINNSIGYLNALNNIFIIVILAVVSAILPLNGIVVIGVCLIIANSFGLNAVVGVFALILYLLMILLYFRFVPKDSAAVVLTPAAFFFHVPALVPITLGQIRTPLSALTAVFGVVSWKYMQMLPDVVEPIVNDKDASILDIVQAMPSALLTTDTILTAITFVVVLLIVYAIRRLISDYSWESSAVAGSVIYLILMITGSYILGTEIDLVWEIAGTVIAFLIALVLGFFYFSVDYSRSEYVQFEDDKNYYYVKILPKRTPRYDLDVTESDEGGISGDDSRFMESETSSEIDRRFEGINLQSKLEESLKTLNTNQNGNQHTQTNRNTGYILNAADQMSAPNRNAMRQRNQENTGRMASVPQTTQPIPKVRNTESGMVELTAGTPEDSTGDTKNLDSIKTLFSDK